MSLSPGATSPRGSLLRERIGAAGRRCHSTVFVAALLAIAVGGIRLILADGSRRAWALFLLVVPGQVSSSVAHCVVSGLVASEKIYQSPISYLPKPVNYTALSLRDGERSFDPASGGSVSISFVPADLPSHGRSDGNSAPFGVPGVYARAHKVNSPTYEQKVQRVIER